MGIFSILPFFQYYLHDIIGVEDAAFMASLVVSDLVLSSIFTCLFAGALSDRFGRKLLVYISATIMTISMALFVICTVFSFTSIVWTFLICAFFGIGYGSYQAVDWAMAIDTLPKGADVAKDMGVWHLAFVIPQVISPLISGLILNSLKRFSMTWAYSITMSLTGLYFLLSTVLVTPIRKAYKGSVVIKFQQARKRKKTSQSTASAGKHVLLEDQSDGELANMTKAKDATANQNGSQNDVPLLVYSDALQHEVDNYNSNT